MQLVAYGAQDIYLTGNPQITFFKVVYRRHTNFSMELIEQTFNGSVGGNGRITSTISRNGDLVHRLYTNYDPQACATGTASTTSTLTNYLSFQMLKTVELEIGGQKIDKLYNHWLVAQHELFTPNQSCSFPAIKSGGDYATAIPRSDQAVDNEICLRPTKEQAMSFLCKTKKLQEASEHNAWVPLPFWFCRNVGLALPLIALQYHEVKVIIELAENNACGSVSGSPGGIDLSKSGLKLWAEYIYLDTDERRRFAQVSHEYLIEQLQFQESIGRNSIDLNFNHPVKELIFGGARAGSASYHSPECGFTRIKVNSDSDARTSTASDGCAVGLKLNGHERFTPQHLDYFTRTQVCQHHSGNGGVVKTDSLGVYSFALKPEEHQPSGTCNFSRIDSAQLTFTKPPVAHGADGANGMIRVYAVNYNVLRIMSGMGGLAYSN